MMTPSLNRLVIASRGSRLALTQTSWVASALETAHPGLQTEVLVVKTTGDIDQRPFAEIGGKGIFTSEVERAVAEGTADIAIHAAKDLTAAASPECAIVAVPLREAPGDVVVGGQGDSGEERLGTLPKGAVVGTSSIRRRSLLAEFRPDLKVVELRGNIDTRLRKVSEGQVDAAILAAAGLHRLGTEVSVGPLGPDNWVPAPGQGALAIQARSDRPEIAELLRPLHDAESAACLAAERAFAARLEGSCNVPLGCLAQMRHNNLVLIGYLGLPDGGRSMRDRISGPPADAQAMGTELAEAILAGGGDEIMEELTWDSTEHA
jgi:hydroxymethylbilane synthase